MNCNQSIQYIYKGEVNKEFQQHLNECETCSHLYHSVNNAMLTLDIDVDLPDGLLQKTLQKKQQLSIPKTKHREIGKYIQIAAVLAAGIFLGAFLGTNANGNLLNSKRDKKDRAYQTFKENHHLTNNQDIYNLNL